MDILTKTATCVREIVPRPPSEPRAVMVSGHWQLLCLLCLLYVWLSWVMRNAFWHSSDPPLRKSDPCQASFQTALHMKRLVKSLYPPQENMSTIGQMLKHKIKTNVFKRAFKHVCVWVLCISTCFLVEILP